VDNMSDRSDLERRYRRLLALYPKAFRRQHGQEMLSVLIAGAAPGQRRPTLAETANLLGHAILTRLLLVLLIRPSPWEYRHARLMVPVRIAIGIWLLTLTVFSTATAGEAGGARCSFRPQRCTSTSPIG
jgi:hypothetical protein